MNHVSRRDALAVLAAVPAAGFASPRPAAAQAVPIRFACGASEIGASAFFALDEGFFAKVGLNAQATNLANGAAIAAAIASGNLEFGTINLVALGSAHENGVPFVWVAPNGAYTSHSPTAGMVVAKSSPIRAAKDLEGKTVAVFLLRQLADIALHAWLDKNGADAERIKYVEMSYPAMITALASGRVDAACIEDPVLTQSIAAGSVRLLAWGYDAIAPLFCEGCWVTSASYAQSNPVAVRKFADAIALTADWANKNPGAADKIVEKYSQAVLPPNVHHAFFPARLRASYFQPVIDAAARYGVLKSPFNVSDCFVRT